MAHRRKVNQPSNSRRARPALGQWRLFQTVWRRRPGPRYRERSLGRPFANLRGYNAGVDPLGWRSRRASFRSLRPVGIRLQQIAQLSAGVEPWIKGWLDLGHVVPYRLRSQLATVGSCVSLLGARSSKLAPDPNQPRRFLESRRSRSTSHLSARAVKRSLSVGMRKRNTG